MAEEEKNLPQTEEQQKSPWVEKKEGWYDKIPLTLKQLDWIIWISLTLLVVVFIIIGLDAMDIFNPFGS